MNNKLKEFYDKEYSVENYAVGIENRVEEKELKEFIKQYKLQDKKVLEIGCGRGAFQNLVADYTD